MSNKNDGKIKVLLVDTLSADNDFGVELPLALNPLVDLTVFTIRGTRLRPSDCHRLIIGFPEYGGSRNNLQKLLYQLRLLPMLAWQLWLHRHGVIHLQFFRSIALELPLYLLLRPFLKCIICTVHNVLPHESKNWHRVVYRYWYRRLDRLHVLSRYTSEQLVRDFEIPDNKIVYAPHGNYARFVQEYANIDAAETRKELGISPTDCLVLYYGQMRNYKGVKRLIEAAARVKSPFVRVIAAGACTSEEEQSMRDLIAEINFASNRMELQIGRLENDAMAKLITAADILVFPYHHVYQSGALMLGLTFGKAIIASDIQGFREYLKPGLTGVLCDTNNSDEFALQIDTLADRPHQRQELAIAAKTDADRTYGWPVIANMLITAYQDKSCHHSKS